MLFGSLMWEEAVYELAVAAPLQLLVIFLLTRMLELRHARVFWTCEIFIIVVFCLLRMQVPSALLPFVGLLVGLAMPLAFSQGHLWERVLLCVAAIVCQMAGEMPTALLWTNLTGVPYTNEELVRHLPVAFATGYMTAFAVIVLFSLVRFVYGRLRCRREAGNVLMVPVLVTSASLAIAMLASQVTTRYSLTDGGTALLYSALVVICVFQVLSILLLYVSADQYAAKRSADLRAEVLARGVEEQLGAYAHEVERIEGVAKVRHDLRNQAQGALLAAGAGERGRARGLVAEMLAMAKGSGV